MKDIINKGDTFNSLTIVEEVSRIKLPCGQTNRAFLCICSCGEQKVIRYSHLKNNKITSCGCSKRSPYTARHIGSTDLAKVWRQMKSRTSEHSVQKNIYFNKGIKVCDEWIFSCQYFYDWAMNNGYKKGLTIDRIDNSKGYYPNNCRWVTNKVNCNNRDVTFYVNYKGQKKAISLLLEEKGLSNSYCTILGRIKRGWDCELAIDTPIKKGNYKSKFNQLLDNRKNSLHLSKEEVEALKVNYKLKIKSLE